MAFAAPGKFRLSRLDYGLITKWSPTALPPGALQQGTNCRLDSMRLGTNVGFTRITSGAPNDSTIKLNGNSNYLRGKITAAANLMALAAADLTFEFVFRTDTFRSYQVLFYRGSGPLAIPAAGGGAPANDFAGSPQENWAIYLRPNTTVGNGKFALYMWRQPAAAAPEAVPFGDLVTPLEIVPGAYYHAVVVRDSSGPQWHLYVHQVGTALGAGSVFANTGLMSDAGATPLHDIHVGGIGSFAGPAGGKREEGFQMGTFQGVIQEVRLWNDVRTTPELEALDDRQLTTTEQADASLVSYQPLLIGNATSRYYFSPIKGTVGSGAAQTPILELRPAQMTWVSASNTLFGAPIVGSGSGRFDGRESGVVIPDSFKYLSGIKDGDNKLLHREQYIVPLRVKPLTQFVNGATIFHWTDVPSSSFTSTDIPVGVPGAGATATESPASSTSIMRLFLTNVGAGVYQFCASLWVDNAGTPEAYMVTSNVPGGLVLGTSYAVSMSYSNSANTWTLNVDSLAAVTIALPAGHKILATPDDPAGSLYKYWMVLGRAIRQVRFSNTNTFDPNAVDVTYSFSQSFDGIIDQLLICGEAIQTEGPYSTPTEAFHAFLATREITRANVFSLQAIVLSAWTFEDLAGTTITDIGVLGNHITFLEDPAHSHGRSGITTNTRIPIRGIFDHRYRSASGEVRKRVAIAGGTVYEIPPSYGALTPLCDGFRNDEDRKISGAHFLDGYVLCCGSRGGNYHLVQDQLYSLAIAPPSGVMPFGLTDQINKSAKLKTGFYKYAATFYSSITGKRSPVGIFWAVDVKTNGANVELGSTAEMNQTYPKTARAAGGTFWRTEGGSENKEPWDMSYATLAPDPSRFRFAGWYGTSANLDSTLNDFHEDWWEEQPIRGANASRRAKKKVVYFKANLDGTATKNAIINNIEEVSADEATLIVEQAAKNRVFLTQHEDGRIILNSCVAGGEHTDSGGRAYGAYLWVGDLDPATNAAMTVAGGVIDWQVGAFASADRGTNYTGTGEIGHGIKLPYSPDPQVTHLEIWRTLADGDDYRLLVQLPNGTPNWKDNTPDSELTGEILDVSMGAPPSTQFVCESSGRMVYAAPIGNEQRLYFSQFGQPWNVAPQNVVDILDGSTLPLTGIAGVNGRTAVFKSDTSLLLLSPSNPLVPFDIQTRFRDIGCLAHFGIVQVNGNLVFPGERGFYMFDGSSEQYLSNVIEPTWHAFPGTYKPNMAGFWDRDRDTIAWGIASTATRKGEVGVPDTAASWCTTAPATPDGDPTGWMALTGLQISYACAIQDGNNQRRVFFADDYGYVYEWAVGTNYGVGTLTPRVVTVAVSNTASTFSIPKVSSYATLPDGYRGFFITWLNAAGTIRETRQIISDDLGSPNAVIAVDHAFSGIPQVGDGVAIGSIEAEATFGEFSPGGPEGIHEWTEIFFRQVKQAGAATWEMAWQGLGGVNAPYNEQTQAFTTVAATHQITTISNQRIDSRISTGANAARGRRLTMRIRCRGADKPMSLRDMSWFVRAIDNGGEFIPVT